MLFPRKTAKEVRLDYIYANQGKGYGTTLLPF